MGLRLGVKVVVASCAGCCVLVPFALAVAKPVYVTPAAMEAKVIGATPQIATNNTSPPSSIVSSVCTGVGAAHAGKFNTFRCRANWSGGPSVVWARALPGGRFCASSTGLASCPPGPLTVGDPRMCADPPAPPGADANHCGLVATEYAVIRAMQGYFKSPTWAPRNMACTGSNVTRVCTYSSFAAYGVYYRSKIEFAHNSRGAWTAVIATTGGGVHGKCTVKPGPASSVSRWYRGPLATCVV